MMADVFDYLYWRGDIPIEVAPFNPVDGMILARLSYLPFDGIVGGVGEPRITLGEACKAVCAIPDIAERVLIKGDAPFAAALAESKRFSDMELFGFENRVNAETQTQFCALTVKMSDKTLAVSFRGTDNTLIGWKEDFNMTFEFPVMSQKLAAEYLERTALENPDGAILTLGHSKGGNLAVYSAAFSSSEAGNRVTAVYNYDGPGFPDDVLKTDAYLAIRDRVSTYIPQSSIVGMLLGHGEAYTIVHSRQSGALQHDLFSWDVRVDCFEVLENVNKSSKLMDYTFKAWVAELDPESRERFFDTVYSMFLETNLSTLHDMSENRLYSAISVLKSFRGLDEPTRKAVLNGITLLFKCARDGYSRLRQLK